jgi:LysM repeat protein/ABC-type branched-subunit amino acid transport system substrate-binding protein
MKFTLIVLGMLICVAGWSQPSASNDSFLELRVEAGQTLYAISKKYNVTIESIVDLNPGTENGLREGQVIRIPKKASIESEREKYVVKSGDTVYAIARIHGITADQLLALNPGLSYELSVGDSLIVPLLSVSPTQSAEAGQNQEKVVYEIAVLLPFYTSSNDSLDARDIRLRDAAVAMYRGILMSVDSLKALGLNAKFRVLDVVDDKAALQTVLKSNDMKGVDLVIGPLFKDLVPDVAAWCTANNAHMVVPVQQPNRVLLNAPSLSKAIPGSVTQWMSVTRYVHKNFAKENVVLVDSKILDDRKLVEAFKEEWLKLAKDSLHKVVVCDDVNNLKLAQLLPAGKCAVAVPTNDKKVISAVWRALGSRTDVDVIGTEAWDDMEAISTDLRNKYHVSFPKPTFADDRNEYVLKWQEAYKKRFKSYPIDFSYVGYDVALYFGSYLSRYGKASFHTSTLPEVNTVSGEFRFFRTSADSGFENAAVNIIRTENYQIYRVN